MDATETQKCSEHPSNDKIRENIPGDWQVMAKNIKQRLYSLHYTKAFSDLTVKFDDGRSFQVHKLILAMHSPVFERMFYGSLPHKDDSLVFEDVSSDTFAWIVAYMYLGVITLKDFKLAIEIYIFAHEKQIDEVVARCSKFLCGKTTSENALSLIKLAAVYNDEELKLVAMKKVLEKRNSIFSSEDVGDMQKDVLMELVSNGFQCSEKDIFKAVHKWARIQLEKRDEEVTGESLRKEIMDFLPKINFLKMSTKYFISNVMTTGIFSGKESISILKRINDVDAEIPFFISAERKLSPIKEQHRIQHAQTLIRYPQCSLSFYYNHMEIPFNDKIIFLKCSENIYVKSIKLRNNCYTGSWKLHVLTHDEDIELAVSSNETSPWSFSTPVLLLADRSYVCRLEGRGKRAKHRVIDYESCMDGISIKGTAIACNISIIYVT